MRAHQGSLAVLVDGTGRYFLINQLQLLAVGGTGCGVVVLFKGGCFNVFRKVPDIGHKSLITGDLCHALLQTAGAFFRVGGGFGKANTGAVSR